MRAVFPAHWAVLPFGEAIKDVTSNYQKVQKSEYNDVGIFPIVDQGQQLYGGFTSDSSLVSLESYPSIVFGDHTRIFKFINEPFCLGADGAKVLEPKVMLDKKFLFYYLSSLHIESVGYSRHFKFLKENVVPVPPLAEQKRIAAILNKADAIRRKRQQAIQLADDFLRAVFLDMFGDPVTNPKGFKKSKLTDLADVITGFAFKSAEYVQDSDGPVRLCRGVNTLTGYFEWKDTAFWDSKKLKGLNHYKLESGDVVLAMDRPWISSGLKVCVFPENERDTYLVQRVARIRPKQPGYTDYLYSSILSPAFEKHCCPTETTVPHISPIELKNFEILTPDEDSVKKYHDVVSKLRKSKIGMEMSFTEANQIFNSLSQKAFSGKL